MQKERRMVFRRSFYFQLRCCRSDTARREKLISVYQRISIRYVLRSTCRFLRSTFRHLGLSVKSRKIRSAMAEANTGAMAEANFLGSSWVRYGFAMVANKTVANKMAVN